MKFSIKTFATVAACAALSLTITSAVETDPVGYMTVTAADGSDTFVGAALTEQVDLASTASGVTGQVVSVDNTLVADSYNDTHYLLFCSGTQAGQWFQVTDTGVGSVTLETDVEALGAASGDEIKIIQFWTLGTLFPDGSGFGESPNPFLPVAEVLLNNLSATGINLSSSASYFYHDGSSPILGSTAGWYQSGTLGASNDVILTPETYFTVRNESGESFSIVIAGAVPVDVVGTTVVSAISDQDNQLVNPYPAALPLDESGLENVVTASANPFAPEGDQVLLFETTGTTINRSSIASYFYHDGSSPILSFTAGWYQVGTLSPSGTVEIPAGGAFWVRKAADASPDMLAWEPPVPYTL